MKRTYVKDNITIIEAENEEEGAKAAFELLRGMINEETLLFLSGGSSPLGLYKMIGKDEFYQVKPGAVATVDERWGPPGHEASNEERLRRIGLYDYFNRLDTEVLTILHGILNRTETALRYDTVLQGLLERFKHSVAIMGIGEDGHTAGLAPNRVNYTNPASLDENKHRLVIDFESLLTGGSNWKHAERITVTPRLLSEIKEFIVLVFGEKKRKVLQKLFGQNLKVSNFPAAIFKSLKGKVYLITDQRL